MRLGGIGRLPLVLGGVWRYEAGLGGIGLGWGVLSGIGWVWVDWVVLGEHTRACISLAAKLTSFPAKVYSRRSSYPASPQNTRPEVMPVATVSCRLPCVG